jgi:ABC-2 type transport system permease protein
MNKILAIIRRDALFDLAFPIPFALQYIGIVVGVSAFHFVSQLVPPSRSLGVHGHKSTYFAYAVVNVAFMVLQTNAIQAFAKTLRRDQMLLVIEPIFVTPTPVELVVFSAGLWKVLLSVFQVVIYLGTATLLFHLNLRETNIATLAVFTLLSLACMSAIGIIGAGIVIYSKQEPPSNFLVGGAASMLAGVLFPVALLPAPLRAISWLLPITHALAGMRAAVAGAGVTQVAGEALWLVVATVVLVPLALFAFSRMIVRARADGTLASY